MNIILLIRNTNYVNYFLIGGLYYEHFRNGITKFKASDRWL